MRIRRLFEILLGIIVVAVGGCTAGFALLAWIQPDALTLPAPTGEHAVGRVRYDWRDEGRRDPLAADADEMRELPVWIWYPARHDVAAKAGPTDRRAAAVSQAEYLPPPVIDAIDAAAMPLVKATVGRLMTDQRKVRTHALAAPPVADGRFPVLLMRPARGALAPQYAVLAEDLASHGYVVVGADMPHTTGVVAYGDGRVAVRTGTGAPPELAPGRKSPLAPGLPNDLFLPVLDVLVADGTFLLDRLADLARSDPRFVGRLDLESVGVFGHSVGGTVALELCAVEPRCAAGIDIDGYLMGSVVERGPAKPFMFLMSDRPIFRRGGSAGEDVDAASRDITRGGIEPARVAGAARAPTDAEGELLAALARVRRRLPNPAQLVVIAGMGHFSFADSALLNSPLLLRLSGAAIGPERGLAVTREYVRTFFDVYLKGRPETALTDLDRRFPEARVE